MAPAKALALSEPGQHPPRAHTEVGRVVVHPIFGSGQENQDLHLHFFFKSQLCGAGEMVRQLGENTGRAEGWSSDPSTHTCLHLRGL